jgi:hypothetical protein
VLLFRKRQEFVMPELDLFLRREGRHVVNHRGLFLHDFIHLADELDSFRVVPPRLCIGPAMQTLDIVQSSALLSLLSRVAEIGVLLQLFIVLPQQRFDPRIRSNVFVHCSELVVFDICNLST